MEIVKYLIDNGADVHARTGDDVSVNPSKHHEMAPPYERLSAFFESNFTPVSTNFSVFDHSQDGPSPLNMAKTAHGLDHPVTALLTSLNCVDIEGIHGEDEVEYDDEEDDEDDEDDDENEDP